MLTDWSEICSFRLLVPDFKGSCIRNQPMPRNHLKKNHNFIKICFAEQNLTILDMFIFSFFGGRAFIWLLPQLIFKKFWCRNKCFCGYQYASFFFFLDMFSVLSAVEFLDHVPWIHFYSYHFALLFWSLIFLFFELSFFVEIIESYTNENRENPKNVHCIESGWDRFAFVLLFIKFLLQDLLKLFFSSFAESQWNKKWNYPSINHVSSKLILVYCFSLKVSQLGLLYVMGTEQQAWLLQNPECSILPDRF